MTHQLHNATREPSRADFEALKARVEGLLATNGRRRGPQPNARDIAFEVRRQVEPLLTDAERLGYDVNESRRYLEKLTRTAGQPATNTGERFEYLAPEMLSAELPGADDDLAPDA